MASSKKNPGSSYQPSTKPPTNKKPTPSKSSLPTGSKAVARQALRQQTRKALRSGMPVKASNKGLGISKNEGPKSTQKAIKTLGYKKAEKVVQRTKARRTTSTGA